MINLASARELAYGLVVALIVLACPDTLKAELGNPLLVVDTKNPQGTMRTFFDLSEELEAVYLGAQADLSPAGQSDVQRVMQKLRGLLDLSQVPPTARRNVGNDTIVFLVDVLRRVDVPALETIPDAKAFPQFGEPASWSIPGTEITVSRVMEGTRKGEFLFSSETVARAEEFYSLVKNLPLRRPAKLTSWRNVQLQVHGWMIPSHLVYKLPETLRQPLLDTPAWKVLGSFLVIFFAAVVVASWHRIVRPDRLDHTPRSYVRRLLTPLALVISIYGARFLIGEQIYPVGSFAELIDFAAVIGLHVAAAWAIWLAIFTVIEWVIASPAIPDQSLDANLLRLLARVGGIVSVALVAAHGAQQVGLPVLGVIAGLGVGGLAVALAAKSSVENLIGGLNLYVDRPIRLGDFCQFGDIKGHVEHIGLRSTKIRGPDRTVTSVPNSKLATEHIINYASRDQMLFQHALDLRYETTTEQLRFLTLTVREFLFSHPKVRKDIAIPRVHVIGFGEWSIKVEVYAYVDTTALPEFLAVQEGLMLRIMELVRKSGSDLAFPSQTTYIARDTIAGQDWRPPFASSAERRDSQTLPFPEWKR